MITLKQARVVFNPGGAMETHALSGVDLAMEAGEFVTVIGSNGAGKSTLLNCISGECRLASGQVLIDETDVSAWAVARRSARVARVFQDPRLGTCEALTIEENLALAAARGRRRGFARALNAARRAEFAAALERLGLGLEKRLSDPIGRLSGGQRQAVSLLMATLRPSRILLLDEHTAALDPRMQEAILALTDTLVAERALTTLMVTHSMRQALHHGTRTVMLHEGKVVLDISGERRKRFDVEDLVALFEKVRGEKLDDDALLLD